jgi:hypothetical protein
MESMEENDNDQPEIRPLPEPPRCRGIPIGDGNFTGCLLGWADVPAFTEPCDCPVAMVRESKRLIARTDGERILGRNTSLSGTRIQRY